MLTTASLAVSKQIVHSYVESPPPLLLALLLLLPGSDSFVVVELLPPDAVEPLPLFTPLASLAVAPSTSSSRALLLLPADISTGAGDDAGAYDVFDALLVASGRSMSADVDAMLL